MRSKVLQAIGLMLCVGAMQVFASDFTVACEDGNTWTLTDVGIIRPGNAKPNFDMHGFKGDALIVFQLKQLASVSFTGEPKPAKIEKYKYQNLRDATVKTEGGSMNVAIAVNYDGTGNFILVGIDKNTKAAVRLDLSNIKSMQKLE